MASKKEFIFFICLAVVMGIIVYLQRHRSYSRFEDFQNRTELDFNKNEAEVSEYIRKYIPNVTDAQMREWEEKGALECMELNGEKRYFRNAAPNLFRIDPECRAIKNEIDYKNAENKSAFLALDGFEKIDSVNVPEIISQVRSNPSNPLAKPVKMKIKYTLTVNADAVPAGETIRCWLPFPRKDVHRQQEIKFLNASEPNVIFSNDDCEHSSVYMEKKAVAGKPTIFSEEFSYTSLGEWHGFDENFVPKAYDTHSIIYKKYTAERDRHVIFSDKLRTLADSLTTGIDNPYLQARAIFTYIYNNFPWASAREYSTIENIPEYVLANRHGDCGQVSLLFITLCRIKGIPARFQSGFIMHPTGWNLHDWSEIYFEDIGWVPVDQSFGIPPYSTPGTDEEYFFLGGIDSYRMVVNNDFGRKLSPAKKYPRSETVDFQRGEVEWRKGNLYFPQWNYTMDIEYLN